MTDQTPVTSAAAYVNARVACEPAAMDQAVLDAVAHADSTAATASARSGGAVSFKPGYPRPIHRLAAADA